LTQVREHQGAHVFAPGIAAAPWDLSVGSEVAIYADVTDGVQRGGSTASPRASGFPKPSDLDVNAANSVLVGWGVSKMTRGQVFSSGV
jgi:hypothetical protein